MKSHTLLLSIPLQEGNVSIKNSINTPLQPNVTAPQHACKHFYGIQHSSTFHCHQPRLIPEFGTTPTSALDPTTRVERFYSNSINTPLQPNVTAPQHACKHFYGIQHSSTFHCHQPRLIPEFGTTPPSALDPTTRGERFY